MNRLTVFKQNDSQVFIFFINPCPFSDSSVCLNFRSLWMINHSLYPFNLYSGAVRTLSCVFKIESCVHADYKSRLYPFSISLPSNYKVSGQISCSCG